MEVVAGAAAVVTRLMLGAVLELLLLMALVRQMPYRLHEPAHGMCYWSCHCELGGHGDKRHHGTLVHETTECMMSCSIIV